VVTSDVLKPCIASQSPPRAPTFGCLLRIESPDRNAPAKYPPTTSGEHLRRLFTATQNG
jgi:hypothetical protein